MFEEVAMNKKRLIDADALYAEIARIYSEHYANSAYQFIHDFTNATLKRIRKAPTVDAVEVVRCKDCKHFEPQEICGVSMGTCWFHEMVKCPNDFCSRGERCIFEALAP